MVSATGSAWGGFEVSTIQIHRDALFTRTAVNPGWKVCGLQGPSLCAHTRFDISDLIDSHPFALVMVGSECPGGHCDCDRNDAAGTGPPHYFPCPFDYRSLVLAKANTCLRWFIVFSFRFDSRGAAYYRDKCTHW